MGAGCSISDVTLHYELTANLSEAHTVKVWVRTCACISSSSCSFSCISYRHPS